jgi:hypothetical protein
VGNSVVSAMTQTPASGPFELFTTPPIESGPMDTCSAALFADALVFRWARVGMMAAATVRLHTNVSIAYRRAWILHIRISPRSQMTVFL